MKRDQRLPSSWSITAWAVVCVLAAIMITSPGCSGCRKGAKKKTAAEKKKEEEEKKKEQPKKDFEMAQLKLQPSDDATAQPWVKPGHYFSATQETIANNFDYPADLHTASVNQRGEPLSVPYTDFSMESTRPAALPKGRIKLFEANYFVPRAEGNSKTVWFKSELRSKGGRRLITRIRGTLRMPGYQFRMVVLSQHPDRYGYLKTLHSIKPPWDQFTSKGDQILYYRVLLPKIEDHVPLPSDSFSWTSIAYLLWDKMDPTKLTRAQSESLIDWLHFGGQIIVSGPESLEDLQKAESFLAEYLPVKAIKATALEPDMLTDFNKTWSVTSVKKKQAFPLKPTAGSDAPVTMQMELKPGGEFVNGSGKLVAERRIGRGRIVVTGFALTERWVINWRGYDPFFHSCLMRRPSRRFNKLTPYFTWKNYNETERLNASLVTNLRYFSRDLAKSSAGAPVNASGSAVAKREVLDDHGLRFGGFVASQDSGLGGWSDTNSVATAARQTLKEAAGIAVPKASFVFKVLMLYLVVLVPLNWGFFRLIRRVEWAWVAAPIIAIAGAVAVVRFAQLDIGFARSQTEIAVLEVHGGFQRGHLTRYTALYTSLTTPYTIQYDHNSAVAQPFPVQTSRNSAAAAPVHFRRDNGLQLTGYRVDSSKTGMLHSEQMYEMGGTIQLVGNVQKGFQVNNDTDLALKDVGVIHKQKGKLRIAWIGSLAPHTTKSLQFVGSLTGFHKEWRDKPALTSASRQLKQILSKADTNNDRNLSRGELQTAEGVNELNEAFNRYDANGDNVLTPDEVESFISSGQSGHLSLGSLLDLAVYTLAMRDGEMKMIGWTDQALGGMSVFPKASQMESKTLVITHLSPAPLPVLQRDVNLAIDRVPDFQDPLEGEDFDPDQEMNSQPVRPQGLRR